MEKVALIGMGNLMFKDEGLGTYLAKYIELNYDIPQNLEIVDGGLMGFGLMSYYQEFDKILIVSTNSKNDTPGTISSYSDLEMLKLGKTRKSANEVELAMMIEICSVKEDMAKIEFITMTPQNIEDVEVNLSPIVLKNMPKLLNLTLKKLQSYGITLEPKKNKYSFQDIIKLCANPKNSDPKTLIKG